MALRLFNTMSARVEEFRPIHGNEVRMYACGPTVYDYGHIGNFRTFVHVDLLRRFLEQQGYKLQHVMNITDVDDKIIRNAARAWRRSSSSTRHVRAGLPRRPRHARPRAARLMLARHGEHSGDGRSSSRSSSKRASPIAPRTAPGTSASRRFPDYGKLSKKDFAGIKDGARVDVDEYEKDTAARLRHVEGAEAGRAAGTQPSAAAAPAGTSSAPPWP